MRTTEPVRVQIAGVDHWRYPDGRQLPTAAGGETPPAPTPPAPTPPAPPAAGEKTHTQADVDRIVQDRLARDRQSREPQKPADYDDLKQKADKFDQLQAENQTALEREQTARQQAEQKAQTAEAERDAAKTRADELAIRSAVVAEASKQGAVDPDAAFALLSTDQTYKTKVTIGDDGQVTGTEQAVKDLLEAKQWLVGSRPAGPGDGGPRTPPPAAKELDEQIREAEKKGDGALVQRLNAQKLAQAMTT